MRPPEFWHVDGPLARLLAPLGRLYGAVGGYRRRHGRHVDPGVPVICVGNVVAGGSGKTPTAIAIAGLLAELGRRPHFLTRGYGGRLAGPLAVDRQAHDAGAVGDEALLLAAAAPTWVARDRAAGAAAAVAAGADVLVMDDGLQNGSLRQTLSLVVLDGGYGLGNGRIHPAGPLREGWDAAAGRAGAVVLVEPAGAGPRAAVPALPDGLPLLRARLLPTDRAMRLAGRRLFAFAGIGRPGKFFDTVVELGGELAGSVGFPDHHRYRPEDVMRVVEAAHAAGAEPVTTEKDWVRLPPEAREMVQVLRVTLTFERPAQAVALLRRALAG